MDNPTRWNITNSAQTIVSALVDPSKQFDNVFRREWTTTFAGFSKHKPTTATTTSTSKSKSDIELKAKLTDYVGKLENRQSIKAYEQQHDGSNEKPSQFSSDIDVPEVFMRDDFDLSNIETFTKVLSLAKDTTSREEVEKKHDSFDDVDKFGQQHIAQLFSDGQLKEIQQRLTDYLDVIEEHLASQISNRSGDFFQVMSSVDCVMDELSLAIKSVTQLRRKCKKLNENLMLPNMKSINLSKIRDNAQSVLDMLNDIAYLCKVQPTVQILLSTSDFVGALELIAKSRVMLHKNLTRVISLRYMESQLIEIERMIGAMMQQEFLTLISSEWDGSLSGYNSAASRLSKLFDYFANGYSEVPDRGSLTLLSLLQIQAEKFVNQFHEERKKRVESALDIEQWKVVEIPPDFQKLIHMIIDKRLKISEIFTGDNLQQLTKNSDLSRNSSSISVSETPSGGNDSQNGVALHPSTRTAQSIPNDVRETTGSLVSDTSSQSSHSGRDDIVKVTGCNYVKAAGTDFAIVSSVIILIRTIMDYCKCAHDIRSLSADLLERLFKILQLYNSKTYHLVYSAGAIQVAGLKTITTRSLIVSQCSLKLIILILPAIRLHFSQLLPSDKRLRRFDEIRSLYEEHVEKIPERVKLIVRDIINLQLQEWEAKPPVPSKQFTSVAQHIIRLHDNIQDTLSGDELVSLFKEISDTFVEVLVMHLRRLNISNDAGPQQWLVMQELTFYHISLNKLKAFHEIELNFDDLWSRLNSQDDECVSNQNNLVRAISDQAD